MNIFSDIFRFFGLTCQTGKDLPSFFLAKLIIIPITITRDIQTTYVARIIVIDESFQLRMMMS